MMLSNWPEWALDELTNYYLGFNKYKAVVCKHWLPEKEPKGIGYCAQFQNHNIYNSTYCTEHCQKFEEQELSDPPSIWDIILSNKGCS